jgi:RNA polymerase sigma factor (sigma-70 family)
LIERDNVIWDDFRKGNEGTFSLIYHQFSPILYQYGFRFTSDQKSIEDAIQDLFTDLIRNKATIGSTDNIKGYLLKAFRRKLLRLLKKEKRYTDQSMSEVHFGIHLSVEENLIRDEAEQVKWLRLNRALEKLTPRQREAIYLRFRKELDYDEVAEILNMSIEACRNLIYRAVKSVRQIMEEENIMRSFLVLFKKI